MKVTVQEIIEALGLAWGDIHDVDHMDSIQALAVRIQQHGIAAEYTPMTDDELHKAKMDGYRACGRNAMLEEIAATGLRYVEQAVLARLGVAPSECQKCKADKIRPKGKSEYPMILSQAKQICEQAGFAVVRREPQAFVDLEGKIHAKIGDSVARYECGDAVFIQKNESMRPNLLDGGWIGGDIDTLASKDKP
jgi:hypothetical protein